MAKAKGTLPPHIYGTTKVQLGGREFVVPALSLGYLRNGGMEKVRAHDTLALDPSGKPGRPLEIAVKKGEIILDALRRNYSNEELPDAEFWNAIDLESIQDAWLAVIGLSGFRGMGELMAAREVAETELTTSNPSIALSPPLTDGQTQ